MPAADLRPVPLRLLLGALVLLLARPGPVLAGPLKAEVLTGASYIVGDYGQPGPDTTVVYAPVGLTLRGNNWHVEGQVPFLQIRGPSAVVGPDGAPVIVDGGALRMTPRQGLGDAVLGAGGYLPRLQGWPMLEVDAKVKFPTAAAGLGTGRADESVQIAAYQFLTPKLMLMAFAGYQWLGSSDAIKVSSGPTGMLGLNYKVARTFDVGGTVSLISRLSPGQADQAFASPYVTWRLSKRAAVTAYGLAGLSPSSPRAGAGMQVTLYFP